MLDLRFRESANNIRKYSNINSLGILSFGGQEISGNVGKCGPIVCFEFWFAIICWCLCLQEMSGNVGKY